MENQVLIYDTTLRDGTQAEGVSLQVEDKLRIARKLDELGIHYIEGGWPGSNPKDILFFEEIKKVPIRQAKIAAFGSTCNPRYPVEKDPNLAALIRAEAPVITLFGKSWDLHVTDALNISLERNLDLIAESISHVKKYADEVLFDAEHFFDGYKNNPGYALKAIQAAQEAGADCIVLCDTNGGMLPFEIGPILLAVKKSVTTPFGIHAHNDSETAVANSLMAVQLGVNHVQGTINGIGERCGNANLCSIIPGLQLKLGKKCILDGQLRNLFEVSRFVNEIANISPWWNQPYVGDSAFAHKGGIHVSAIRKNSMTYEHIDPALVGNQQRVLVSELSGKSNLLYKAREFNVDLSKDTPETATILKKLKELENLGFQFEAAEGSLELLMKKALGTHKTFFDLVGFRVIVEKRDGDMIPITEATIRVKVNGQIRYTAAMGDGPVDALDAAFREAVTGFYPSLKDVKLIDYKVRILNNQEGTAAKTRVLIESQDEHKKWGTVGVSENIIEASWQALVDSIEYKLLKDEETAEREDTADEKTPA
ncbi:MAG: citramalate synthase [bacterium]